MPRVKAGERKRAKRPKTRTGCPTCKGMVIEAMCCPCRTCLTARVARRIKCDECKPFCRRCTSTGRKCDGYEPATTDSAVSCVRIISPWDDSVSLQEKRAFQFFRQVTGHQLSGSRDRALWTGVLVQAAYEDVRIRHAIVALSTLHEYFVNTGEAERVQDDFALRQYNAAIRQYIEMFSLHPSKRPTSYVVACIVFICIELLQGHYHSALSLISSCTELFYDEQMIEAAASPWPLEAVEFILHRLQTQVVGLMGGPAFAPRPTYRSHLDFRSTLPLRFESMSEAQDYFERMFHAYIFECPSVGSKEFAFYANVYCMWSSSFAALKARRDHQFTKRDERTAKMLTVRQLMTSVTLDMASKAGHGCIHSPMWDNYVKDCEAVLSLAESILQDSTKDTARPRFHFTLELGVVGPLYDLSWGCRDPAVRRKAISLLRDYPRREGLWDSVLASRVAEHRMQLEEAATSSVQAAGDVPVWARISSSVPTFKDDERRATMVFQRHQSPLSAGDGVGLCKIIEW